MCSRTTIILCGVVMIRGLVELLDCLDDHYHVVLSWVRGPWTWGFFVCFYALFHLPNVGQGYNEHDSLYNYYSLCVILPSDLCLSRENLHNHPPCIRWCMGMVEARALVHA